MYQLMSRAIRVDPTTKFLFCPFDREVATPHRRKIYSYLDFVKFIEDNNGINDCYASVYSDNIIDKIFYDFDGEGSLAEFKTLYGWCVDNRIPAVTIASGKKGYHLYVLLRAKVYEDPKEVLTNATYSILRRAFSSCKPRTVDPHIIGDVRRISRIPNTLRPPDNAAWCTYLPPDDVWSMDERDVAIHIKRPHTYPFRLRSKFTLDDFYDPEDTSTYAETTSLAKITVQPASSPVPESVAQFLKPLLRPCLLRHITSLNPSHYARTITTIDLLLAGISKQKVLDIYSKLGWIDFDQEKTSYQINKCSHYGHAYSCRALKQMGIPKKCCVE